jgi:hypothetical protein
MGVALWLLSLPAGPERVWLYTAGLNEPLLAPDIRCIQDSSGISLVLY